MPTEALSASAASYWQTIQQAIDENLAARGEFMHAARRGKAEKLKAILDRGFPVNYQDPETRETALHLAAAHQARKEVLVLLATGRCNFLIRDKEGCLASELAYLHGNDPALARLLGIKEKKQADRQGIKLTRRPGRRSKESFFVK